MRRVLFSLLLAVTACGSADESPSFDASRADKWNGVYLLESVSSFSNTSTYSETPTGICQISLRHIEGFKYEQTVEFDCSVGLVPIVKRSQKQVNIDDSGTVSLIDQKIDEGASATLSPTYYTATNNQEKNVTVMRFRKQ